MVLSVGVVNREVFSNVRLVVEDAGVDGGRGWRFSAEGSCRILPAHGGYRAYKETGFQLTFRGWRMSL